MSLTTEAHAASDTVYSRAPGLKGYTYTPEESYGAKNDGRLLAIRLETNTTCNLRCQYCYAESGDENTVIAEFDHLRSLVDQASDLGAESIVVIGGGEPTLYPRFRDLIAHIHSHDIIPVIFSNTIEIDRELADFLYDHNASMMGKLDSLDPETQDFLVGREGISTAIRKGLDNLIDAGFTTPADDGRYRLGVSFVSNRKNVGEIEDIWHFCRERNIFPNMEILTPTGRAKKRLAEYTLTADEIRDYKYRLLDIDRTEYGFDWLPYTPLTGSGCLQHLYSFYITLAGDVRPCAPTKFDEHPSFKVDGVYPYNVYRMSLEEIYNSELFRHVRDITAHLGGKCNGCEHNDECIGCRGYAYSVGVNEGLEPLDALAQECRQCFKPAEAG